jgi:Flp pilus assembly pilin Flp
MKAVEEEEFLRFLKEEEEWATVIYGMIKASICVTIVNVVMRLENWRKNNATYETGRSVSMWIRCTWLFFIKESRIALSTVVYEM